MSSKNDLLRSIRECMRQFEIFFLQKLSTKVHAFLYEKSSGPTEIRTRIARFRVLSDNPYTMEPLMYDEHHV